MVEVELQSVEAGVQGANKPPTEFCYERNLLTGQFHYISPSAEQVLGSTLEELLSETIAQTMERIHPEDRQSVREVQKRLVEIGGGTTADEFRLRHADGSYIWLRHTAEVLPDDSGVQCIIVGSIADITESKKMQARFDELQTMYENLRNMTKLAVCESRMDGSALISCNENWARLIGFDTIEECVMECVPGEVYVDKEVRDRAMAQIASGARNVETEAQIRRKDGAPVWLHLLFCRRANGETLEVIAADITVKKLLSGCEIEVLKHLMAGLNNKQIALKLSRSLRTIENHRAIIMSKLGVKTSIELTKRVVICEFD